MSTYSPSRTSWSLNNREPVHSATRLHCPGAQRSDSGHSLEELVLAPEVVLEHRQKPLHTKNSQSSFERARMWKRETASVEQIGGVSEGLRKKRVGG